MWDALSGDEVKTFAHNRIVKSARFSKDDFKIVTGGQDKILRIWDLNHADDEPTKLEGHTESIKVAVWAGNDNFILSGGSDGGVRVWDVRTRKQVSMNNTKGPVTSLEVCLDGRHVICTSGKNVTFLDAEKFEEVKTVTVGVDVNSASLSPDGQLFVAGCVDFSARVFDFKTNNELEMLRGHHGPVHAIRFAPDGATFASGSEDGTLRLWQAGDPRCYGLWQETNKDKPDGAEAEKKE
jgi:serine-threonine kinase receptor-associated protein